MGIVHNHYRGGDQLKFYTGLTNPFGLAVSSDDLFVSNFGADTGWKIQRQHGCCHQRKFPDGFRWTKRTARCKQYCGGARALLIYHRCSKPQLTRHGATLASYQASQPLK